MKYKLIALIGESGSGKDTILNNILKKTDFHKVINCTTRPIREGEQEGVNYYYLSNEEFAEKVLNMSMIEATSFNGWLYGTSIEALDSSKINIGVFNPYGIDILFERNDIDLEIIHIKTTDKNRLIRQLNREENPNIDEIIRRFKADKEDFSDLDFFRYEYNNNELKDIEKIENFIIELASTMR